MSCRVSVFTVFTIALVFLLVSGCGTAEPIQNFRQELQNHPEYAVILEDMKEEGSIFKDHYHRYRVLTGRPAGDTLTYDTHTTGWIKVDEQTYRRYDDDLGMTLLSKTPDGEVTDTPYPPGYQYVGNEQYGRWANDASGNRFWVFFGQYALLRTLLGGYGTSTRVRYDDYTNYRTHRSRGTAYYGGGRYGTQGSVTQRANPTFYERRQARTRAARSGGSSVRTRSRGFGK